MLHKELGDFCVVYELNVYSDAPADMMPAYTRLHRSILDVFNEYGVQIMTPAYEADPKGPQGRAEGDVVGLPGAAVRGGPVSALTRTRVAARRAAADPIDGPVNPGGIA